MSDVSPPPSRPLLIFDGDCSFCRRWITRWKYLTGDRIDYEPFQSAAQRVPQVSREQFGRAVYLVEPDGRISRAVEAVFRSLALAGRKRHLLWLYKQVPAFRWAAELLYRFIAANRNWLDILDRIVVGTETRPATYVLTRAVFLRAIGIVYLIAFISLFVQIDGLIGSNGILPASGYLERLKQHLGTSRWWITPTLAHFNSSDAFLHGLCIAGIVCSSLLIVGVLPMLMTIALFVLYLSLVVVGDIFLSYQWDVLLLEAGFLAILFSPLLWIGRRTVTPSRIALLMLRLLLFKLMFLSALVKLTSGDETWWDMTALRYHFETQPIPTWTSWYAHHSPHWMLAVSCFGMFVIEGIVPFAYFAPRRTRMLAFWLTVLLQVNIMLTGNYGFFNLLAIALALTLLDDAALGRVLRMQPVLAPRRRPILRPLIAPIAFVLLIVGLLASIERLKRASIDWPTPLAQLHEYVQPFRVANGYGLFETMTTERPEIIIEGSDNGQTWKACEFKWKAGDLNRAPRFCEPHMPRLDWQMWFAALNPPRYVIFLDRLVVRIVQRQPEVLELMETNPFPDHTPRYLRGMIWNYRFSDPAMRRATGAWWTREPKGQLFQIDLQPPPKPTPIDQSSKL